MSDNMLDFQCPHCSTNHRLPIEFAGNRQPCNTCGKTMRLPSAVGDIYALSQEVVVQQSQGGAIMVTCPLCNKTLYASKQQAGKDILCETCLESIAVPALQPSNEPAGRIPNTPEDDHQNSDSGEPPAHPNPNVVGTTISDKAPQLSSVPEPESAHLSPNSSKAMKDSESAELDLKLLPEEPQISSASPVESLPPVEAVPVTTTGHPESFQANDEIIELEAVGEAPSIPVQKLQSIPAMLTRAASKNQPSNTNWWCVGLSNARHANPSSLSINWTLATRCNAKNAINRLPSKPNSPCLVRNE